MSTDTSEELPSPQCDSLASWATQANRTERLPGFHCSQKLFHQCLQLWAVGAIFNSFFWSSEFCNFKVWPQGGDARVKDLHCYDAHRLISLKILVVPSCIAKKILLLFPCAFELCFQQQRTASDLLPAGTWPLLLKYTSMSVSSSQSIPQTKSQTHHCQWEHGAHPVAWIAWIRSLHQAQPH